MPGALSDASLQRRRVLVVEDEYLLADDLRQTLEGLGIEVVGPVASVAQALDLLQSADALDGAVLDVNLQGDSVFPVLDLLRERGVPFLLTTGYDEWAMPAAYADAPRCVKPLDMRRLSRLLDEHLLR